MVEVAPGDLTQKTEESYNGTSWSELAEINTARTEANLED